MSIANAPTSYDASNSVGPEAPVHCPVQVLACGPWDVGEFTWLRSAVDRQRRWPVVQSLGDALEIIDASAAPPELILLAQPRPGTESQEDVERLRRVAPLTRIVIVAGSWCEGELRTGQPLAGVVRLYWYEFPAWWRAAATALSRGECPPWSAPIDDVRSGQLADSAAPPAAQTAYEWLYDRRIVIDAVDCATYEAIAAAVEGPRYQWRQRNRRLDRPTPNRTSETPAAGVWDGGQLSDLEQRQLAEFCQELGEHTPVLVLLDFPRAEHLLIIEAAGAAALMAKPYSTVLLQQELARLVAHR